MKRFSHLAAALVLASGCSADTTTLDLETPPKAPENVEPKPPETPEQPTKNATLVVISRTGEPIADARIFEIDGVQGTELGLTDSQGRFELNSLPTSGLARAGFKDASRFLISDEGTHQVVVLPVEEQPELSALRNVGLEERYELPPADRYTPSLNDGSVFLEDQIDANNSAISRWVPGAGTTRIATIPRALESIKLNWPTRLSDYRLILEDSDQEQQGWLLDVEGQRILWENTFGPSADRPTFGRILVTDDDVIVLWSRRPLVDLYRIDRQTGELKSSTTLEFAASPRMWAVGQRLYIIGHNSHTVCVDGKTLEPVGAGSLANESLRSTYLATHQYGDEIRQVGTDGYGLFGWKSSAQPTALSVFIGVSQNEVTAAIIDAAEPAFFLAENGPTGRYVDVLSETTVSLDSVISELVPDMSFYQSSFSAAGLDGNGNPQAIVSLSNLDRTRDQNGWIRRRNGQFEIQEIPGATGCKLIISEGQIAWAQCEDFASIPLNGEMIQRTYLQPSWRSVVSRYPFRHSNGIYWRFDRLAPL